MKYVPLKVESAVPGDIVYPKDAVSPEYAREYVGNLTDSRAVFRFPSGRLIPMSVTDAERLYAVGEDEDSVDTVLETIAAVAAEAASDENCGEGCADCGEGFAPYAVAIVEYLLGEYEYGQNLNLFTE